jgi:HlyD family secretion protein
MRSGGRVGLLEEGETMVSQGLVARSGTRRAGTVALVSLGGALLVVLAYGVLPRGLGPGQDGGSFALRPQVVSRGSLHHAVAATGRMEPLSRVPVKSEVSGLVRRVRVEEGDRVEQGQVLFELDRERLQDRANALRAGLQVKRAAAQWDLVGRASLELEQARRDHERIAKLYERGVTSEQEFEDSRHKFRLAEVSLTDARAEEAARAAAITEAEHRLSQAEKDLARALIRAPIDGLVVERPVDIGAVVADVTAAGATLLAVVADDQRIRLVAEVDENDIAPVRVGQEVDVTVDAFPGEEFKGKVRKVSSSGTVEHNVSNFEIEIELPADERLRVGMSADARVVVHKYRDVVLIPNVAIVRGGEGPRVRVRDADASGGFRLARIEEGYSDGFQTVVRGGVEEGEVVLIPSDSVR